MKLLNEKNDDEDEEARIGLKKRNELLQQLLKDQDDERKVQEQQVGSDKLSLDIVWYCIDVCTKLFQLKIIRFHSIRYNGV